jgi:hypothetical protein
MHVKVVAKFSIAPPLLHKVDDKTSMKRFQNVIAAPHLSSIISATLLFFPVSFSIFYSHQDLAVFA